MSSRALLDRCTRGERQAWSELIEQFSALVYYAIYRTLRRKGLLLPEDQVAELHDALFLSLLEQDCRRLRLFSGRSKLSTWIKVCTVNLTLDHLRRQRPALSLEDATEKGDAMLRQVLTETQNPESMLQRREAVEQVQQVLAELPAEDRLLLLRCYGDEASGEELATELHTTVGAIYARRHRLKKRLSHLLAR